MAALSFSVYVIMDCMALEFGYCCIWMGACIGDRGKGRRTPVVTLLGVERVLMTDA